MKRITVKQATKTFYIACIKSALRDSHTLPFVQKSMKGFMILYINKDVPDATKTAVRVEMLKGMAAAIQWAKKEADKGHNSIFKTLDDLFTATNILKDSFLEAIENAELFGNCDNFVIKRSKM